MKSTTHPVRAPAACGQSVWLDYIRRDLLVQGGLAGMIADDGVRGMTPNPAYEGLLKTLETVRVGPDTLRKSRVIP